MAWGRRQALALIGFLGVVVGVVGWGGFNTVMEATNSMDFCISCHEMRDNVYGEYRQSTHYQNPSGVRAVCADCHVPRDWTHKLLRKAAAGKEVYHWLLGSIDTPEKFESRRHELAGREWARMRASDSRECRNCHAFEAMDFHRQNTKAAQAMRGAMAAGKTCIDCHKGIAHKFPDVAAGHRRTFVAMTAAAAALALKPGAAAYALRSLSFHLERPTAHGTAADGEIAPATAVKILAVDGGAAQVEIVGWRREGSEETLFARPGKRMPLAALGEAATAKGEALRAVVDPDTELTWTQTRLTAWTAAAGYVVNQAELRDYGARMYEANCSLCHAAHAPGTYAANEWVGHLNAMKRLTKLDGEEAAMLLAYLQSAAKDVAAARPYASPP